MIPCVSRPGMADQVPCTTTCENCVFVKDFILICFFLILVIRICFGPVLSGVEAFRIWQEPLLQSWVCSHSRGRVSDFGCRLPALSVVEVRRARYLPACYSAGPALIGGRFIIAEEKYPMSNDQFSISNDQPVCFFFTFFHLTIEH
jgi:hypothetical protein